MAGEETKESLQAKVKAAFEAAAGSDAKTFGDASREHWRQGEYLKAAGEQVSGGVAALTHGMRHPIETLQSGVDASIDTIKAAVTPSAEGRVAAEKQNAR